MGTHVYITNFTTAHGGDVFAKRGATVNTLKEIEGHVKKGIERNGRAVNMYVRERKK